MLPAISQTCTMPSSMEDDFDAYGDAGAEAVELWLTKVEEYLKSHSVGELKDLAAARGLKFAAGGVQGGILFSQGEVRKAAWDLFEKRLQLCSILQIPTLVVVPDIVVAAQNANIDQTDIERGLISARQGAELAAKFNVRLALEFQGRAPFLNNLESAVSFVDSVQHPHLGLCVDLHHFYVGPSKHEDLRHLHPGNLFHVQVSDLADVPRELASDSDRILPGDGDFLLAPFIERLREIEYRGYVSLEVWNPTFWQIAPSQVADIGLTSLRQVLGLAKKAS